jgi:hypothetical protein
MSFNFYACYTLDFALRRKMELFDPVLVDEIMSDLVVLRKQYMEEKKNRMQNIMFTHMSKFDYVLFDLEHYHKYGERLPALQIRRIGATWWEMFPPYRFCPSDIDFYEYYDWE